MKIKKGIFAKAVSRLVFFLYYVWWRGGVERGAYSREFIQV